MLQTEEEYISPCEGKSYFHQLVYSHNTAVYISRKTFPWFFLFFFLRGKGNSFSTETHTVKHFRIISPGTCRCAHVTSNTYPAYEINQENLGRLIRQSACLKFMAFVERAINNLSLLSLSSLSPFGLRFFPRFDDKISTSASVVRVTPATFSTLFSPGCPLLCRKEER